jgi:hypothetical protein
MSETVVKKCPCPICKPNTTFVKSYIGTLMECTRHHKFYLQWGEKYSRDLVLAVAAEGHQVDERFPVPDDVMF